MRQVPYSPPRQRLSAFHCPSCGAFAQHIWHEGYGRAENRGVGPCLELDYSVCEHCGALTIWYKQVMVYPDSSVAPSAHPDMPADIALDFKEARAILSRSPRGAAALFRLCIQKLCTHLGETGKDLNADIGALVRKGLNPQVQQSLDIVRVIGNESVHPGVMDLGDDESLAVQLAELVNIIVDALISQPQAIGDIYERLPKTKLDGIDERDK